MHVCRLSMFMCTCLSDLHPVYTIYTIYTVLIRVTKRFEYILYTLILHECTYIYYLYIYLYNIILLILYYIILIYTTTVDVGVRRGVRLRIVPGADLRRGAGARHIGIGWV